MTDPSGVPAPPSKSYSPSEVILYGVRRVDRDAPDAKARIWLDDENYINFEPKKIGGADSDTYLIAVIYGYGFEGHCYRLDRPRMLVFPVKTYTDTNGAKHPIEYPAQGCGFDGFGNTNTGGPPPFSGYLMWRVESAEKVVELSANKDTLATIILEANLPGRRAPNTYSNNMQLAHRSGRLTST